MSIAGALSNALSGLNANARAAELVSSNVANAMTDGYGMRSLELSARSLDGSGSGVRVEGVVRHVDEALISDRRLADASLGFGASQKDFLSGFVSALGVPDDPGSLSGRVASFQAALVEAAARPDSEARLSAVLASAQNVAKHLNSTADFLQYSRLEADQEIAHQVNQLNAGLSDVQELNTKIQEALMRGVDPSGMMDLRQQKIDEIASIVPLKQIPRDHGQVALITTNGALLLDGKAAELAFSPVNTIVAEMTVEGSALSGLTINGRAVDTLADRSPIAGGSLAGNFQVRDVLATDAQVQLDAFTRDFLERFQDASLDPTITPGGAGFFTDGGIAFDPTNEAAISSRIEVNASVVPAEAGALWRIRDGVAAVSPGEAGNSGLLNRMISAIDDARVPVSGSLFGAARSASGLAADLLSNVGAKVEQAETRFAFALAQHQTLRQTELSKGVDTDAEMQKLMLIEQAYAANARVISTTDEMIQIILGL